MEFPPGGGTVPLPKSLHQPSTGPFVPDAVPQSDGSCVPVRDSNQILMILILLWLHLQFQKSGNHVETLEG